MSNYKFITEKVKQQLPPIYSQENKGDEAIVYAKWFCPWSNWTWYATELDPNQGLAFGLVVGFETELGYFSLPELEEIEGPAGLRIERDLHFTPITIKELRAKLVSNQRIVPCKDRPDNPFKGD